MRSALRYFVAFGLIVLLVIIALSAFTGGANKAVETKPTDVKLADYIDQPSEVRLIIGSKITADEDYRSARITITPSSRTVEILKGYQQVPERTATYANNQAAYAALLHALEKAGFAKLGKDVTEDESGQCPLGKRYVYELTNEGKSVAKSWSTSCGREGSLAGNGALIRQLLTLQIPDYKKLVKNTGL